MITPIEIRQHTFKAKALGGYDKDEVNAFMNMLSLEWEKLLEDHRRNKTELEKSQSNLENYKKMETALHSTLLQADQASKSMVESAKKDAELRIQEAESKYRDLLNNAMKEKSKIELEISQLTAYRNDILQQLKVFLTVQADRLHSFEEKEMKKTEIKPQPRTQTEAPKKEEKSLFEPGGGSGSKIINDILEEL